MPWTYSYPIPIDFENTIRDDAHVFCKAIGSNIYIFANTGTSYPYNKTKVFLFDPKAKEFQKIPYEKPENFGHSLERIDTDGKHIYLWKYCLRTKENRLFKFDIITRSMTYIVTIVSLDKFCNCPIFGDRMYALGYGRNGGVYLITIDLSNNEVINGTLLESLRMDSIRCMDTVDDKLHIFETQFNSESKERMVYKIDNGELVLLSSDIPAKNGEVLKTNAVQPGRIIYKHIIDNRTNLYMDTFDYGTLEWNREELDKNDPWNSSDVTRIHAMAEPHIDGPRYYIIHRLDSKYAEFELRVFDNSPRLATKCYLNIVDAVAQNNNNNKELDNVKSLLPSFLSEELELTAWKVREKQAETSKNVLEATQMKRMMEQTLFLWHNRKIDSAMIRPLFNVFNPLPLYIVTLN